MTVSSAADRWLDDCRARKLKPQTLKKYVHLCRELEMVWGERLVSSVRMDDVRKWRESWKLSALTEQKRLELVRAFFSFCEVSGWIQRNPAKGIKLPSPHHRPTMPFSEGEWADITTAIDVYARVHEQVPQSSIAQLRALLLLLRYSGLRISDAVSLERNRINDGKLFLYQAKTGHPVMIPLQGNVLEALGKVPETGRFYFWSGEGKLKSRLTDWQARLKTVFQLAGIHDGHAHRLRDTFSVDLLSRGVPLQTVSILLGHRSLRVTEQSYAPWVRQRQDALEAAVKMSWDA